MVEKAPPGVMKIILSFYITMFYNSLQQLRMMSIVECTARCKQVFNDDLPGFGAI